MVIIGIDNGLAGGLAAYNKAGFIEKTIPMPIVKMATKTGHKNEYDIPAIVEFFEKFHGDIGMVVLERAHAFPGMSAQSTFANGRNVGIMEGILSALELPYTIVHSKTWQKAMFEGIPHDDTKQASILVAKRLFPGVRFSSDGKWSKKDSDGITDALLMAVYGSRVLLSNT